MKKLALSLSAIGIIVSALTMMSSFVFAQGMMGAVAINSDGHTAREETEGKIVWEKLQAKQIQCSDLSNDDFGVLGEYFMGQMTGTSHETMNIMMEQMMGKEGEEQIHIVLGKRLSGCDTSAAFPSQGVGFMPMMQMMMGGGNNSIMGNWINNPMGWFGFSSWLLTLIWIVWLIVGILAAIWLWKQINKR